MQRLPLLLLTAIPLALTSISMQLAAAAFAILSGFRENAVHRPHDPLNDPSWLEYLLSA
jgi:hypothetical protein